MAAGPSPEHTRLISKLETIAELSTSDRQALAALPLRIKTFDENTDLVREGRRPNDCCLILDGLACRYKVLGAGQRQIMSFHPPGDVPDFMGMHLAVMDHSLGALTPGRSAYVSHAALRELLADRPGVAQAFWRDVFIDAAISREWLAGVGRRAARQRIAHLICELCVRLRALDLIVGHVFALPVTQAELGDALGLSTVHVNRVLQDLRRDHLITLRGRTLTILDWARLRDAGDFDAAYLHLRGRHRD
jgi:CRP-like cAMP-binding protein